MTTRANSWPPSLFPPTPLGTTSSTSAAFLVHPRSACLDVMLSSMDESKFAPSCVWCTEGLRLCADSIRRRMYPVRAGGTTGVAGMSAMPQRPGKAQGQAVPGIADGAHRLEARVAGDGGAPVRVSGVRPELRGFPPFAPPYVWYTYRLQAFVESLWGMMTVTDLAVVTGL